MVEDYFCVIIRNAMKEIIRKQIANQLVEEKSRTLKKVRASLVTVSIVLKRR